MINMISIGTISMNFHGKYYFLEWERPQKLNGSCIFFITVFLNGIHYITNKSSKEIPFSCGNTNISIISSCSTKHKYCLMQVLHCFTFISDALGPLPRHVVFYYVLKKKLCCTIRIFERSKDGLRTESISNILFD